MFLEEAGLELLRNGSGERDEDYTGQDDTWLGEGREASFGGLQESVGQEN